MRTGSKCPKCGEGEMSSPVYNKSEDCLNRRCCVCGYVNSSPSLDNKYNQDATAYIKQLKSKSC